MTDNNKSVQITVGKNKIGIIGLYSAIDDVAKDFPKKNDDLLMDELIKKLSKKNYIPDSAKNEYGKAFIREYKKHLDLDYEEEVMSGLEIKVLGEGCARCEALMGNIINILNKNSIAADVEHIRDIKEISRYGVMGTPALVINNKVVSAGNTPSDKKLLKLFKSR